MMNEDFIIENGVLIRYTGGAHSIAVPNGVRIIGKEVFKGMSWITDVSLPEGIVEIDDNAFKGCRQLGKINFPDGLERIGDFSFHRCHSLTSVILPDSVISLGRGAFLYCDSLQKFKGNGVKKIQGQSFTNDTQLSSLSFSSEIDCSNFRDDIFAGCIHINEILLSDGYRFHADNLMSVFCSETEVHPVVRAVAEALYQSMEIRNGVMYKLHVNLKSFKIPEGVRCIEKSCFFDKRGVVSVSFPMSLERIKANAFGNCISLEQITFAKDDITIDDDAFRGCSGLKKIVVGEHVFTLGGICYGEEVPYIVRRINDQAMSCFYISGKVLMSYTGNESRVNVPDGIEVIGESCFEGNDRINRVIMSNTVREIHENAFRNCICMQSVVMSENLRTICRNAFENCKKLIRFNIPDKLENIGFAAFRGCKSLELTQFETGTPAAVHHDERSYEKDDIEPYSFCGDENITELYLDKPIVIGKYAFSGCPNLRSVVIDNSECIIEKFAFEKCGSLREIRINAGKMEKGAFSFCRDLEKAEINSISLLEDEVFAGCSSLREVKISDELSEIGRRCFDECTSLTGFDFSSVRKIGERAFERCDSLTEVKLSKADVGYHAFADCSALRKIIMDSDTKLQSGAFWGCTFADTIVYEGIGYSFSGFSQSRNIAENQFPVAVQEIIGSIYSCFEVNRELAIVKYKGDAVRVRIPDDIVSAEDEAFRDHLRLTDIDIPKSFGYSGKLTFSGTGWIEKRRREVQYNIVNGLLIDAAKCGETAEIPENTERICSWAFAGNTELKELTLRNDRIIVDVFAFRNCINLKCIHFSDGKTYTLESYSDISDKEYPELVRQIFSECLNCFKLNADGVLEESTGNIKNLVFPKGIKAIASQVYMDCLLLESIVMSHDTASVGKSAFQSSKWLKSIKNADGIERIEAQAFSGCKSLESIDISDNLEFLGRRAFEHCCSLKEIHISDKISVIPERAFFRCKSLRKVVIPSSVRKIESQAFAFCSELSEVIFCNADDIEIADDAFAWCDKL